MYLPSWLAKLPWEPSQIDACVPRRLSKSTLYAFDSEFDTRRASSGIDPDSPPRDTSLTSANDADQMRLLFGPLAFGKKKYPAAILGAPKTKRKTRKKTRHSWRCRHGACAHQASVKTRTARFSCFRPRLLYTVQLVYTETDTAVRWGWLTSI